MPRPSPLPRMLRSTPFASADADPLGVGPERLRRADLAALHHGARIPVSMLTRPAAPTTSDRALAYLPVMHPSARFSHLTAAELHGLRMPERRAPSPLHVTSSAARAPQGRGIRGHRSLRLIDAVVDRAGLPLSSPVQAWIECAELLRLDDLIVMGDGLVRRRDPLATTGELAAAASEMPGRRGAARLRAALLEIRPGTDSARETTLRLLLARAGLGEPEVNGEIRTRSGAVIAHGDIVFRDERVAVEYDGRHHDEDPGQYAIDIRRLDAIMEEEYRVIRVDRHLMRTPAIVLAKVRTALQRAR